MYWRAFIVKMRSLLVKGSISVTKRDTIRIL